jgi:hypothetical protein
MEFWTKRVTNLELQNSEYLESLKAKGFCWIRRYYPRFDLIIRNPTLGYPVEIFTIYNVGCVKIDSYKGKKIINKLCYF